MKEIWEAFKQWVLHKLQTHCDECDQAKECKNCEYYRNLIEQERAERSRILGVVFTEQHTTQEVDPYQNVRRSVPWHIRQRQLENQHKIKETKVEASNETETVNG